MIYMQFHLISQKGWTKLIISNNMAFHYLLWIIVIHFQFKNKHNRVWFILVNIIPDFVRQKLNNKISISCAPLYWKSPSDLRDFFSSKLGCTSLLYDSEIHALILQIKLILMWQLKKIVILNEKLYNVYLFKYNSYFYHDMYAVSIDKVKEGDPNWLYVNYVVVFSPLSSKMVIRLQLKIDWNEYVLF